MRVGGRIERVAVDPVQDAGHPVAFRAQQPIQPLAVLGRHDFLRIRGADRRHDVVEQNPARHEVEGARDAGAHAVFGQPAFGETGQRQRLGAALSLVGEVVNREHRGDVTEGVGDERLQVVRNQRGMPIVTVHHLRWPLLHFAQVLHQRQHAAREQNEPAIVVRFPVNGDALEGGRNIEEIDGCLRAGQAPYPQLFLPLADGQERGGNGTLHREAALAEFAEVRHDDAHVVPRAPQRRRKGTGHIGQSTRLDQGGDFSRREENVHLRKMQPRITWGHPSARSGNGTESEERDSSSRI